MSRRSARLVRVLIVGGGPAGMTAALALKRAGTEPEVVEIEPEFRPGGTGLLIQDSPLRALETLDLVEAIQERGYAHEVLNRCDMDGVVQVRIPYPSLLPGRPPAIAISRNVLAEILAERAEAEAVPVRFGVTVDRLEQSDDGVDVVFSDGSVGRYDLVVGADGVHSTVRRLAFGDSPGPDYTGQFIWRASAPRPPDVDEYFMHVGPVSKVGLYPVSGDRLYLFLLQASPLEPTRPEGDLRALLRSELEPFGGHVAEIAQRLDPGVDFRGLKSVIVPAPWHRGRVLLIGDAAHATTPHIGYGLGIAVEDAIVLAELAGSGEGIAEILDVFTLRRFGRCRLVVENSRQLGEWEQNPPDDPSVYGALMGQTLSALAQPI